MGLDMHLYRETYLGFNYEHRRTESTYGIFPDLSEFGIVKDRISEITELVAYWRKANHIHQWFVDNVQNGVDNCARYYVDFGQLKELVDLCKELLKEKDVALYEEKLPTQEGFFFGDCEYNENYVQDLKDTIKQIKPLWKEMSAEFYYQSSW